MGEGSKDILYVGFGKPTAEKKPLGRRGALKIGALSAVAALAAQACTPEAGKSEAEGAEFLQNVIGRKENPHPEYGHLIWSATIVPKTDAKLRFAPTTETPQVNEWPFGLPAGGGDPVIRNILEGEIWLIQNPLFTAQEPVSGGIRPATVNPQEGKPYDIELQSVWFAVPTQESKTGIGWFYIDDVHFLDENKKIQWERPVSSIIQTKISGPKPWEGTATLGNGIPLQVGMVARK